VIPANDITAWAHGAPWPSPDQVEQDLLLSQLICLIAADDYLGDELVFRGGTCLHKLYLHPARRYSEDLDYVRRTAGGIGKVTRAISDIGASLGYEVRTKMSAQPKVYLRYTAESGTTRKIKVEVNTHERSPATSTVRLPYEVTSNWWSGQADVHTFSPAELVATKIRALYQRRKGRDLVRHVAGADRPEPRSDRPEPARGVRSLPAKRADRQAHDHLRHGDFRTDTNNLIAGGPSGYDIDVAAQLIINNVLSHL
jgi:Nucleotidyl transferase AbiEii toxin, Type IV TA system